MVSDGKDARGPLRVLLLPAPPSWGNAAREEEFDRASMWDSDDKFGVLLVVL
jgi:hypothetical protein